MKVKGESLCTSIIYWWTKEQKNLSAIRYSGGNFQLYRMRVYDNGKTSYHLVVDSNSSLSQVKLCDALI